MPKPYGFCTDDGVYIDKAQILYEHFWHGWVWFDLRHKFKVNGWKRKLKGLLCLVVGHKIDYSSYCECEMVCLNPSCETQKKTWSCERCLYYKTEKYK